MRCVPTVVAALTVALALAGCTSAGTRSASAGGAAVATSSPAADAGRTAHAAASASAAAPTDGESAADTSATTQTTGPAPSSLSTESVPSPAATRTSLTGPRPDDTAATGTPSADVMRTGSSVPVSDGLPEESAQPGKAESTAAKSQATTSQVTKPQATTSQATASQATKPKKTTKPKVVVPEPRIVTQRLLAKVNAYRRAAGVKELKETTCADESALAHARAQAADRAMAHRTGGQIQRACDMPGGENVAFGYATPAAALAGWWRSPAHRSNILDPRYRYMGVAVAYAKDGAAYYTQVFYIP